MNSKLSVIAVIGKNRELGKDNRLLWKVPGDLPRFKALTTGHPVIMGRKTFESLPPKFRPLPGRTNIIISSNPSFQPDGVIVVQSIDEAIKKATDAPGSEEVFITGGGSVYAQAIEKADRLYITVVDASTDADTFFPEYSLLFTNVISKEQNEAEGLHYTYYILEKS